MDRENTRGELACCGLAHPPPETSRRRWGWELGIGVGVEGCQSLKGAIVTPERHPLPNFKQDPLLTKSSWDSGRLTSAARDQLLRRDMAHLRRRTHCTPRKPSGWDGGGNKTHHPPRGDCVRQAPGHLSFSDPGRAQNAGPTQSVPS